VSKIIQHFTAEFLSSVKSSAVILQKQRHSYVFITDFYLHKTMFLNYYLPEHCSLLAGFITLL